jgi:hypothetical protein
VQELEVEICVTPDDTLLGHLNKDAVWDVDIALGLSLDQTFQEEVDAIPGIEPGHSARQQVR